MDNPFISADFQQNSEYFKRIKDQIANATELERRQTSFKFRTIKDRYRVAREGETNKFGAIHPGDIVVDNINRDLDKVYRSPTQKEFHKSYLAACLRIIYGDDYERERHRVMAKYEFESKKQQVLICAPRRMGKTFATALFAIVFCVNVPTTEMSIFSPGKRQSVALMGHVFTFMKKLGEDDRVLRRNEEKMVIRSIDGRDSKFNAYPAAVRTLKGVSGTVVVLEEMAQIPPEVLFEVVVPLHQIDITCMIGISTITDENNFMTKYLKKKDKNGDPLFAVKHLYLACKPCRDTGKAASCNHNSFLLPAWSSARKRKAINCIMEDQEELLNREIGGMANALHGKAFTGPQINALSNLPLYQLDNRVDYPQLFIGIDPNGCGKSSDFAMCSILRYHGQYVIIGLESFQSINALENHGLIVNHVRALEQIPEIRNALKVFILESNLGLESEHIKHMLDDNISNFLVMNEKDGSGKIGFQTTNSLKDQAVEHARERLGDRSIRFGHPGNFVSVSKDYESAKGTLLDQMAEFAVILKEDKTYQVKKPVKMFSGKSAGKDDLVIAFLLCMYWSGYFYSSGKYDYLHKLDTFD